MAGFVAYHGLSASDHQSRVDELAPQGFRPVSLNVSGDPGDARYAAVWIQRPGVEWVAMHGVDAATYQARFDELVGHGLSPSIVSATGPAASASFTALFERVPRRWFARHNLRWGPDTDPDTITHENGRASNEGYLPLCLSVYGDPSDPRYAGIWVGNERATPWSWWSISGDAYQRFFDALVRAGTRPVWVAPAPNGSYLATYRDEPIGEWAARHGLDGIQYQAEFDQEVAAGRWPLVVQASGAGGGTRYASVFVRDDTPLDKRWTVTGAGFAGDTDLDETVRGIMQASSIRAGSVAVARNGTLVANRGYTWAEDGYAITQPDTLFRLASVSKLFASAALEELIAAGTLSATTAAFPFLGITSAILPSQTPDPLTATITVRQLATQMSGLQRDFGTDLRTMAARLGRTTTPTRDDTVRYLYGEPLDHAPGTGAQLYSNSAVVALTSVIELAAGQSLVNYLTGTVLAPLGITDVFVAATPVGARRPGEVPTYDCPVVGDSLLDLSPGAVEATAYGGQFVLEIGEGAGGLLTSTGTVARTIGTHAVWDSGPRMLATRHGDFDGTCAGASSRADGLDFAYAFNRRVPDAVHDSITQAIHAVLNRHGAGL
jgi:CubicO group peptidase (beta-lactamase class C family)